MQPNNPNDPNNQLVNNSPQQIMPNQNPNGQPVQNTSAVPNYANQQQNVMPQQIMTNQGINMTPQQPAPAQVLNNNQQTSQNANMVPSYNQVPVNTPQYSQSNNQQNVQINNDSKPNFAVIALIILQIMYTSVSLIYMSNLFSSNDNNPGIPIMVFTLFIIMTIGYAFLLFNIFLKKYWALMIYVGAMAVTTTIEIKEVVAYNNIAWSYVTSLIFTFTLLGLSIYLATAKKKIFN